MSEVGMHLDVMALTCKRNGMEHALQVVCVKDA